MKSRSVCVALALAATVSVSGQASAQGLSQYGMWGEPTNSFKSNLGALPKSTALLSGGARPEISAQAPQTIAFANGYAPGSVVIDTAGRKLYYTLSASEAYAYPVAVGKQGFTWTGVEKVSRIEDWPDWIPPAEMRARKPSLPVRMTGGLNNPLGVKAIYLGSTLYRIHGTNDAESIGEAASSGCFRMHNGHVVHLAGLVNSGTTVYVLKRLPKSGVPGAPAPAPAEAKPAEPAQPAPASDQKI